MMTDYSSYRFTDVQLRTMMSPQMHDKLMCELSTHGSFKWCGVNWVSSESFYTVRQDDSLN